MCGGNNGSSHSSGGGTSAAAPRGQEAASGPRAAAAAAAAGSGKAVIDCARVNDNFADCPDGSDEPGTSAASHLVRFVMMGFVITGRHGTQLSPELGKPIHVRARPCPVLGAGLCVQESLERCSPLPKEVLLTTFYGACTLCRGPASPATTASLSRRHSWTTASATAATAATNGRRGIAAATHVPQKSTRTLRTSSPAAKLCDTRIWLWQNLIAYAITTAKVEGHTFDACSLWESAGCLMAWNTPGSQCDRDKQCSRDL